ncbi:uncharacterized protein LOC122032472 [Zingiber officinale]|uniref:Uncharacterized protein n=1 Tax=Zingiber officinale TaxID=94328 RepID=A0A8J5EUQ4_ZINOF|nr:uncharacterized protein LOC122032472 [Zingiber officinale]KAG6471014.1 hypothetical protein ZIOFF_072106 [Zingiber officinale]
MMPHARRSPTRNASSTSYLPSPLRLFITSPSISPGHFIKQKAGGLKPMVVLCFLVDQRRRVRSTKPAAGICSRCGACARVADMETATRFCYVPVHRKSWRAIICTFCGALLRSYYN